MDELRKTKENLIGMIKKMEVKPDYTPQEVINIKEAAEAIYKIQICEAMCKAEETGDYEGMYGTTPYYHDMRDMDMRMYGRGRSRDSMGRFTGNDEYYGRNRMYGHSIRDRMIDNLERMMDSAGGDYERKEIQQEIDRLRTGN